jgi:hypothetical protein
VPNVTGWFQVRSTKEGLIPEVEGAEPELPVGEPGALAVLNVVTYEERTKVRKLPSLYLGKGQFFIHREEARVREELESTIQAMRRAANESVYLATPCELDGHLGLYFKDYFNRSKFRRGLERAGVNLAPERVMRYAGGGRFESETHGEFTPEFVIPTNEHETIASEVIDAPPGEAAFMLSSFRFGMTDATELGSLIALVRDVHLFGSGEPAPLVARLRDALAGG